MRRYLTALVGAFALVGALAGPAAAGCGHHHHHPKPPPRHLLVSATFTDQTCTTGPGPVVFVPGSASHSEVGGVWWTTTGSTLPGDTLTFTAHAQPNVIFDTPTVFAHKFPVLPQSNTCLPRHHFARFDVKKLHGCVPTRRYVMIVHKHHIARIVGGHNKARTKWHFRLYAQEGFTFRNGSTVKNIVRHNRRPKHGCGHPHSS
jgi:hypothetical protein